MLYVMLSPYEKWMEWHPEPPCEGKLLASDIQIVAEIPCPWIAPRSVYSFYNGKHQWLPLLGE